MSNFINGVQAGYSHSKRYEVTYNGANALLLETERLMRAKIRGHKYEGLSTRTLIVGEKYEPLFFKIVKGSGRHEMIAEGKRDGDVMIAEKHSPWTSNQVTIPLDGDVLFSGHHMQRMDRDKIEVGEKYTFHVLDPELNFHLVGLFRGA